MRCLRDFIAVAKELSWLLVGATARDVFLHYAYELPVIRATKDVDIAVQLPSWKAYEVLKESLLKNKQFTSSTIEHRLKHRTGLPLDLSYHLEAFASAHNRIKWPSDVSKEMSVAGYEDVLNAAELVKIASNPDLIIPITTLPWDYSLQNL